MNIKHCHLCHKYNYISQLLQVSFVEIELVNQKQNKKGKSR